jgi:hypothetical protein
MICWRCHSNSINTGSRLPNISDVKTRKRRNVIGIDMIRNNRIVCTVLNIVWINSEEYLQKEEVLQAHLNDKPSDNIPDNVNVANYVLCKLLIT